VEFNKEVEAEKRKKTIRILEEGVKSDHWIILKSEVELLIKKNEIYLEAFNRRPIKDDKELTEHTRIVQVTNFMRWFLGINERIIEDNLSFFKKMERFAETAFSRVESFVKK
jgi:hypothetical protein